MSNLGNAKFISYVILSSLMRPSPQAVEFKMVTGCKFLSFLPNFSVQ